MSSTRLRSTLPTLRTFVFRTVEDASVTGRPERCPWPDANLFLAGRMSSLETGAEIGTAQACAQIAGPLEPGAEAPFYAEFNFAEGERYRADGSARVLTNDVPVPGVVLAGCSLRLLEGPAGFIGGIASSTSIFNPTQASGLETGSIWTLLAYFRD
jgi:hypothetical protein